MKAITCKPLLFLVALLMIFALVFGLASPAQAATFPGVTLGTGDSVFITGGGYVVADKAVGDDPAAGVDLSSPTAITAAAPFHFSMPSVLAKNVYILSDTFDGSSGYIVYFGDVIFDAGYGIYILGGENITIDAAGDAATDPCILFLDTLEVKGSPDMQFGFRGFAELQITSALKSYRQLNLINCSTILGDGINHLDVEFDSGLNLHGNTKFTSGALTFPRGNFNVPNQLIIPMSKLL